MTSEEIKSLEKRLDNLSIRFKSRYLTPFTLQDGHICFQTEKGHYFLLTALFPKDFDGFIVIEHADSLEEVKLNRFEDGDAFYMDDMTEDEMFDAMVREIESD